MKYVVGIDQATHCGYAVLDIGGQRLASGVWDVSPRPGEGAGFRFVRFVGLFRQLLDSFGIKHDTGLVFYEQPISYGHEGNRSPNDVGAALVSHIQYQCEMRGLPYSPVAAATAKKAAGSGRNGKLDMVREANSRWGLSLRSEPRSPDPKTGKPRWAFPGGSDNEADALWIAEAGRVAVAAESWV